MEKFANKKKKSALHKLALFPQTKELVDSICQEIGSVSLTTPGPEKPACLSALKWVGSNRRSLGRSSSWKCSLLRYGEISSYSLCLQQQPSYWVQTPRRSNYGGPDCGQRCLNAVGIGSHELWCQPCSWWNLIGADFRETKQNQSNSCLKHSNLPYNLSFASAFDSLPGQRAIFDDFWTT